MVTESHTGFLKKQVRVLGVLLSPLELAGKYLVIASATLAFVRSAPADTARTPNSVFTQHCIKCHSGDHPKSALKLDSLANIVKGGSGGDVIEPGNPAASRLIQAVKHSDDKLKMPPDGKLSEADIATLVDWVKGGAVMDGLSPEQVRVQMEFEERARIYGEEKYWAFRPVVRPDVPVADGAAGPIDAFILAKLREKGIAPSPEADRRALIRRVYLDVLGLPPTPEEIDAFVNDPDPEAYAKLIDRVLASPHYGERWARHWLDIVRFAETNGYETNTPRRNAWPYRDYVIQAINNDIPYTQFIAEQLAGDAFGKDIATGFLVGGANDEVKSPDIVLTKNQRDSELHDMTVATGVAFLGLTVGCAKCHDHKFDPISRRDYYSMRACFEGVKHGERPFALRDDDPRMEQIRPLRESIARVESELLRHTTPANVDTVFVDNAGPLTPRNAAAQAMTIQKAKRGQQLPENPKLISLAGNGVRIDASADEDVFSWKPGISGAYTIWLSWQVGDDSLSTDARYYLDTDGDPATRHDQVFLRSADQTRMSNGDLAPPGEVRSSGFLYTGNHVLRETSAVLLRGGPIGGGPVNADIVAFTPAPQYASVSASLAAPVTPELRVPVDYASNTERFEPVDAKYVRMIILESFPLAPCIDEIEIFSAEELPKNLAASSAGAIATASSEYPQNDLHKTVHLNDGLYGNSKSWIPADASESWIQIELKEVTKIDRVEWARDRTGQFTDRLATKYIVEVATELGQWRVVANSGDRLPKGQKEPKVGIYGESAKRDPQVAKLFQERDSLKSELNRIWPYPERIFAGTFEQPGPTHVLRRGDPMQEEDSVAPAALGHVQPALRMRSNESEQLRRIKLAQWIGNRDNPVTARVMANRIWKYHFGRGIVDTPGDFGAMGGRPTHPELLDWLATEFMDRGWSMKAMHRLILTSQTYRQSSTPRADAMSIDADTLYLWRFPSRRLEAEPIRDSILFVSGKLDTRMGGPGYDPFEPDNTYVHIYVPKKVFGPEEFRRMIYQWKPRREQDYTFGAFDCPDASQATSKRVTSTSPLQALNLLNSPFCVEQSKEFAKRVKGEVGENIAAQIRLAFLRAFGREPDADEMAAGVRLVQSQGLVTLCRALYNADEFVYIP
jgi:mono/diheme cytochrome c family protein